MVVQLSPDILMSNAFTAKPKNKDDSVPVLFPDYAVQTLIQHRLRFF